MRHQFLVFCLFTLSNISFAQSDYVKLKVKIEDRNGDTLIVRAGMKIIRAIPINKEGYFADSFKVNEGTYQLSDRVEMTQLYLRKGYDLKINVNARQFDETIIYEGIGSKENNFIAQKMLLNEKYDQREVGADSVVFKKRLREQRAANLSALAEAKLDPDFVSIQKKEIESEMGYIEASFKKKQLIARLNNTQSPSFDFENFKGGTTKLEDLRGKYVYIDIWATWCAPCIAEIPFLKEYEEKYTDKNIVFVSLSVDTEKNHEKWKNFVKDRALTGVQIIADKDWRSQFIQDYGVDSIPRFILIGPDGKIVDADAPRPSSKELATNFDKLLK